MSKASAVYTRELDSMAAGRDLGRQVIEQMNGSVPDAVIVFASARFDYPVLLTALQETCQPRLIVGSSSAGEFTTEQRGEGTACALAISAPDIRFAAGLGRGVQADRAAAARDVVASFRGLNQTQFPYHAAVVMTDALAGHADDLIEQLTLLTAGKYQFAGGGAGDDARFSRTHVFLGTEAHTDAVVALEMVSTKPIGVGVGHGWIPATEGLRVTEADGMRLVSLDGMPAVEAFEAHAERTGQTFSRETPLPFFLHNIVGIETVDGHRLRVPLAVEEDGAVMCAAEIPAGSTVRIMKTTSESAIAAAASATKSAIGALGNAKPGAAVFFDCVATRLRMGDAFGFELDTVARALGGARFVGCNTYGQIARSPGQFSGFHNCTAVLLVLPA
ncbi:MAG: FIST N-terminal domain-containing protein [Vicinamibacterales bacterium]